MKNKNIIAVQNLLRCLSLESLKNLEVVTNLVRAFGIMYWPSASGPEVAFIQQQGAGLAQTPSQIAKTLVYLSRFRINSFCEIGVYFGGNFLFCSEYLRRFNPDIHCTGIDPGNYLDSEIRAIIEQETWLNFKSCTSDEIAGMGFDLIFLDGDHTTPWITRDWVNVGQIAKICAFHDLQEPTCPDVGMFWATLQNEKKVKVEFLDDPSGQNIHGIGIIHERKL